MHGFLINQIHDDVLRIVPKLPAEQVETPDVFGIRFIADPEKNPVCIHQMQFLDGRVTDSYPSHKAASLIHLEDGKLSVLGSAGDP